MVKVAVVDDAEMVAMGIKKTLERYDFGVRISVDDFMSGRELLENALKIRYDILIMDIELSEEHQEVEDNGMYLASKIKTIYPDTTVIYITGTTCYKSDLLYHEPFRYIQKPLREDNICKAVEDAIYRIENVEDKGLRVQIGGIHVVLKLSQVTYFVSERRKITVCMESENISFYENMNHLEKRVRELSDCFVRVGKSYLVNLQYVRRMSKTEIELLDLTVIPVSRKYKDEVVLAFEGFVQSFKGKQD